MAIKTLAQTLRELRRERKQTLREVAAELGMDIAILSKWERGLRPLTREVVIRLAGIYGQDPKPWLVQLHSEKVLHEITGEDGQEKEVLMAAEQLLEYKNASANKNRGHESEKLIGLFQAWFESQTLVSHAWLFGSYARGDDTPASDIDVVIDVPSDEPFTFFDLAEVRDQLQRLAGRKVDVVMRKGLRPAIWENIKKDLLPLYEKR